MNDNQIEQEIHAKGLTAPRITPADIEANIADEFYFTADEGVCNSRREMVDLGRNKQEPVESLALLTFCVLVLRNGFTVTGESYCFNPENFDAEIGRKIARQNAVAKIWPLMGYELRTQLCDPRIQIMIELNKRASSGLPPHQQRVLDEKAELDDRAGKLAAFFDNPIFSSLVTAEQERLRKQHELMTGYSAVLGERIAAFS